MRAGLHDDPSSAEDKPDFGLCVGHSYASWQAQCDTHANSCALYGRNGRLGTLMNCQRRPSTAIICQFSPLTYSYFLPVSMVHVTFCLQSSDYAIPVRCARETNFKVSSSAEALPSACQDHHFNPRVNSYELVYPFQIFSYNICEGIELLWSVQCNQDHGRHRRRRLWHIRYFNLA